jgi:hypothetical protein
MKKLLFCLAMLWVSSAQAQGIKVVASCATGVSPVYDVTSAGATLTVDTSGNLCVGQSGQLPAAATPLSGNAAGTTGAVVGTLAAAVGKTTYICGFNVQAIGGTAATGPITIAGLIGSSQVYQGSSSAAGGTVASASFTPCIPASAANTAITITTTANGTATATNVNSWGYRQ